MTNFCVLLKNAQQTSNHPDLAFEFETEFVHSGTCVTGEAPRCEVCGEFIGSLTWLPPFRAQLETWGTAFGDIAFGPGDDLLVSERLANAFRELNLFGLGGFERVEINGVKKHRSFKGDAPGYLHVSIARSNAAIDDMKSELSREGGVPCAQCRLANGIKRARRLVIENGTWSGEDIFRPRGLPGKILVSERFTRFCDKHGFKNAVLVPAENFSFDHYPWECEGLTSS